MNNVSFPAMVYRCMLCIKHARRTLTAYWLFVEFFVFKLSVRPQVRSF